LNNFVLHAIRTTITRSVINALRQKMSAYNVC